MPLFCSYITLIIKSKHSTPNDVEIKKSEILLSNSQKTRTTYDTIKQRESSIFYIH